MLLYTIVFQKQVQKKFTRTHYNVVAGFNKLMNQNIGLDVELIADGESFSIHRAFMMASSPFLYNLFSTNQNTKVLCTSYFK
jgi:BTB/POZ domain